MKLKNLFLTAFAVITPIAATAQEAKNADLKKVASHLDMDGQFFMANNIEGDIAKIVDLGADWLQTAAKNGKEGIPKDLDLEKIFTTLGGDQVYAYGRSAKFAGDHWVNKMFVQTNGSNKGLLSLSGEKAQPFAASAFAPSGSDLALEMNMDARQLTSMMKLMEQMPKCPKTERMMKGMSKKLPSGITMEEMLNQLNLRISAAVKLDDNKRVECPKFPEYTFPEMHSCMRVEGFNPIWKEVGPISKWVMNHEVQEDGTTLLTPKNMPKRGMMKDKKPVILIDEKNNLMWAASSIEFLTECRSDGAKLKDDTAFKAISGGLTEGNGLAYISKQTCMEIRQVKEAKYKKMDKKMLSDDRIKMIMDHLTESKNGYFAAMTKSADGIHMVLKAPCPIKEICGGKGRRGCRSKCSRGRGKGCGKGCSKCEKSAGCEKCEKGKGNCGCDKDGECKCPAGECKCEKQDAAKDKAEANPTDM